MGRAPCCEKSGLKKGPWTPEEDEKLIAYIKKHGQGNWRTLPKNAGERPETPMELLISPIIRIYRHIHAYICSPQPDRSIDRSFLLTARRAGTVREELPAAVD
jgi:hypothetical protein